MWRACRKSRECHRWPISDYLCNTNPPPKGYASSTSDLLNSNCVAARRHLNIAYTPLRLCFSWLVQSFSVFPFCDFAWHVLVFCLFCLVWLCFNTKTNSYPNRALGCCGHLFVSGQTLLYLTQGAWRPCSATKNAGARTSGLDVQFSTRRGKILN